MQRRSLLRVLSGALGIAPVAAIGTGAPPSRRFLLQESPLAGFQYHAGERCWRRLTAGDPLSLVREPENSRDGRAVAVYWHGNKLGYVPRMDNAAISQLLDRGEALSARIVWLGASRNPWKRIRLQVVLTG